MIVKLFDALTKAATREGIPSRELSALPGLR